MWFQGFLLPEYYAAWARYHVLFLQAYQAAGLPLWGLTAQNEPLDGNIPGFTFNCMGWNASSQAEWVGRHLGPALDQAVSLTCEICLQNSLSRGSAT